MIRRALGLLALAGLAMLALSHLGWWFPPGDSLAVLRPQLLVAALPVLAGLALAGSRRLALAGALAVAVSAAETARVWIGTVPQAPGPLTLYQKNLLWMSRDQAAVEAEIAALSPDILTFQEVIGAHLEMVSRLREAYPTMVHCPWRAVGGPTILTRLPATETRCPVEGLALARVDGPGGPLWIAALHLHWPFPYGQGAQLEDVVAELAGLDAPLLLGGDFNMVAWGAAVGRVAEAGGAARAGRIRSTYTRGGALLPLPIDHVLVPEGASASVELRPRLGSDHLGLFARIALP